MTPTTRTPEQQCAANVQAWLWRQGLGTVKFTRAFPDRVFTERDYYIEDALAQMADRGILEKRYAGNHGPNVVVGYRECVPRAAAQVIVHDTEIEIDFDSWQPWDVRGGVMHFFREVVPNYFRKRKTDPYKISAALKERGINA